MTIADVIAEKFLEAPEEKPSPWVNYHEVASFWLKRKFKGKLDSSELGFDELHSKSHKSVSTSYIS